MLTILPVFAAATTNLFAGIERRHSKHLYSHGRQQAFPEVCISVRWGGLVCCPLSVEYVMLFVVGLVKESKRERLVFR